MERLRLILVHYFGFGRSLSPFKGCAHRLGLHTSPSAALKCIGSQRGPSFRIGSRSSGHEGFLPLHRLGPVPPASRVPARASASRAPCPGVYCTGTLQVLSKLIDVVDGGQSRSHKSSVRQMFENTQDKTEDAGRRTQMVSQLYVCETKHFRTFAAEGEQSKASRTRRGKIPARKSFASGERKG